MQGLAGLPGYERLDGGIPVVYPTGMEGRATELRRLLEKGTCSLSEILGVEPPELEALLVADGDWEEAPRDNARPYPLGLPYFTRAVRPPALVLPETLSPAFQPRTAATGALVVWHELAHASLLRNRWCEPPPGSGSSSPTGPLGCGREAYGPAARRALDADRARPWSYGPGLLLGGCREADGLPEPLAPARGGGGREVREHGVQEEAGRTLRCGFFARCTHCFRRRIGFRRGVYSSTKARARPTGFRISGAG